MKDLKEVLKTANELLFAAKELRDYASYAEMVGGVSVNRPQIREWCDKILEICKKLPENENYDPVFKIQKMTMVSQNGRLEIDSDSVTHHGH